jgi:thiamine-monophosphate kinase
MEKTVGELGEKKLLERLKKFIGSGGRFVRLYSEDCAVIDSGSNYYQLITIDTMVENVHFNRGYSPPDLLGRKLYHVNSSDIAAMGGSPLYFMITVAMPPEMPVSFLDEFYAGMMEAARAHGSSLIGGNLVSSPVLFFDLALVGEVDKKKVVFRNGAQAGDVIFLTGALGASAEGLRLFQDGQRLADAWENDPQSKAAREAMLVHLDPPDHSETGRKLAETGMLSSMIDLSDGLAADLAEICRESGTGALIEAEKIPVADCVVFWETRRQVDPLRLAIEGGEDYHLLFTVRRESYAAFWERARSERIPVFEIGRMVDPAQGIQLIYKDGRHFPLGEGFQHFKFHGSKR